MAKLIYVANVSLDGYIEDAHGRFEWTAPIDEVFTFITDLVRPVGTYLYGRAHVRDDGPLGGRPHLGRRVGDHGRLRERLQRGDKIVYSTTLQKVSTTNTRLERRFDPKSVREMKATAASDLTVGGPTLAAYAFNAGWSMSASSSFIRCSSVKESPHSPARPRPVGAAGRAPVRQRCREPRLPHPELTPGRRRTGRRRFDDPNWGSV